MSPPGMSPHLDRRVQPANRQRGTRAPQAHGHRSSDATVPCWLGDRHRLLPSTAIRTPRLRLDGALFGTLPEQWFGLLGRPWWLTDAASLAYVSYYLLPVVLAGVLWATHRAAFERFTFAVVAMFLASYVGYFLMPTSGPRVPLTKYMPPIVSSTTTTLAP